jgi:hypothetical protein
VIGKQLLLVLGCAIMLVVPIGDVAHASIAARGLGALSQAGKYGIQPYNALTKALKGTGLQAHHLIEQRFAGILGQNAKQGVAGRDLRGIRRVSATDAGRRTLVLVDGGWFTALQEGGRARRSL